MPSAMDGGFLRDQTTHALIVSGSGVGISVKDPAYGAKADWNGSTGTDDTAAIQAAITAATGTATKLVYAPAGSYYIATGLTLPSGVSIVGDGIGLTKFIFADVASVGIDASGTAGSTTALTTNLAEGDLTAVLTSVSGLAAGDLIYLNASSDVNLGRWVPRIRSIASLTATLDEPSPAAFTVAQGAQATSATWVRRVGIRGISFSNAAASPTTRVYYVKFSRVEHGFVERCEFSGLSVAATGVAAIVGTVSRDLAVRDCVFDAIQSDSSSAGVVDFDGVTEASVTGNVSRNSTGGISLSGCPRSVVANNRLTGAGVVSAGRGIKLIQGSNFSSVTGNVIQHFGTSHTSIHVTDSWGCDITGNSIAWCGPMQVGGSISGRTHHLTISGNVLRKITGQAISVTPPASADDVSTTISGNTVSSTTGHAILVQGSGVLLVGNNVEGYAGGGFAGINISSAAVNCAAIGNYTSNASNSVTVTSSGANNAALFNHGKTTDAPSLSGGAIFQSPPRVTAITYSASMTPKPWLGVVQQIVVTNGTAFTIAAAQNPWTGAEIIFDIKNSSGGAMGVVTWDASFLLAGAFTNPANGKRRTIRFYYDGTSWIEQNRAAADI